MKKMKSVILASLLGVVSACDNRPPKPVMPKVNDMNCQMAVIMKIEDQDTREEFAGLCSRRSVGSIEATEKPANWLELIGSQEAEK